MPVAPRIISAQPSSASRSRIWRLGDGCAVCSRFSAATVAERHERNSSHHQQWQQRVEADAGQIDSEITEAQRSGSLAQQNNASTPSCYEDHAVRISISARGKALSNRPLDTLAAASGWLIAYERQFQCGFLSFERSIPARPCADRCATGKCQPCLIAMKRRPKHKAPPARAETP